MYFSSYTHTHANTKTYPQPNLFMKQINQPFKVDDPHNFGLGLDHDSESCQ